MSYLCRDTAAKYFGRRRVCTRAPKPVADAISGCPGPNATDGVQIGLKLHIRTFTDSSFGENAYLVWRPGGTGAVVIDPGAQADSIGALLEVEGLSLHAILLTHAHLDHVSGVAHLATRTQAPIYLHPADAVLYENVAHQAALFGTSVDAPPPADRSLADNDLLEFDGCTFEVRHVPGHSPGHVLFYVEAAGVAFVGDVVFMGSIGRTDLFGGDYQQLMRSIRDRILTLPPDTALFPGHGPSTTVGRERATNPFLVPHFGGEFA